MPDALDAVASRLLAGVAAVGLDVDAMITEVLTNTAIRLPRDPRTLPYESRSGENSGHWITGAGTST